MRNRCKSSWRTPEQGRVRSENSSPFETAASICGVPLLAGYAKGSAR